MKRIVLSSLVLSVVFLSAFRRLPTAAAAPDILATLGLTSKEAETYVFQSVWSSYLSHPTGARIRAVALGDRPALAREAVAFARAYVASPGFRARYAEMRKAERPEMPEEARPAEDQMADAKKDMQTQIDSMEAQAKRATGEMKAMLEEAVKAAKEQLAEMMDPGNMYADPEVQAVMAQSAQEARQRYEADLAEWEKTYPEDPSPRVAARIREGLAECADVDFSAKLRDGRDGHRVFVSTEYEEKSDLWKLCYRAGPETVAAVRAEAERWLAELH